MHAVYEVNESGGGLKIGEQVSILWMYSATLRKVFPKVIKIKKTFDGLAKII